ncbi:MAG: hypothetical protein Q4Q24_00430 [Methanobrevibacter ruminantium]|uniref:hypothetical protein n=1 Tax=Methanobrevibacter ruminantium TaxID=83816 RepID=UPI0026E95571|nr:hypothetical protein [Methanobrevibacter ruminantium]MDO5841720.1 hypothetical protein [Methanobrevibacter ruminantium]
MNNFFIIDHLDDLIELEDYVPFSFVEYGAQDKRDDFLRSKNLLSTMQEMNQLITAKCEYYEDTAKAWNSLIIEWLDCHPEFEGVIAEESFTDYQNMKNSDELLDYVDLLYGVELPSEKDRFAVEDTSSIRLPNFQKKKECFVKYPNTLLSCYLSYLV